MTPDMVIFLGRRAVITVLMMAGPLLAVGLAVGLLVSIFQAVTSIREMTLTIIPKIVVVFLVLIWILPWMTTTIVAYASDTLQWLRFIGT